MTQKLKKSVCFFFAFSEKKNAVLEFGLVPFFFYSASFVKSTFGPNSKINTFFNFMGS